jgi:hypothetical protein
MLICLYEDRHTHITGVKLLVLSLTEHCPKWPIRLQFPDAPPSFRAWISRFEQVQLLDGRPRNFGSFNVKPSVLLDGLRGGSDACIWIDTDVIVNGALDDLFCASPDTLIATQDPWEYTSGSTHRTASWGLAPGRNLPGPLNSAVVRVTSFHIPLLNEWHEILQTEGYLAEQKKAVRNRNQHILSDQDGLSALMASRSFARVPLRRLLHTDEILQHHGPGAYAWRHRQRNLTNGLPPLLHAMGTVKPWRIDNRPSWWKNARSYYERIYLELSPYVYVARRYASALDEPTEWMAIQTLPGRISSTVARAPCMAGLSQAMIHRLLHSLR